MNAEPCMDVAAIEKLIQIGGKEFASKMIDLFLSYVPEKLAEARAAGQTGDLFRVQKAVHPIKSSAANVGARLMQDLAARLEQLAMDRRSESVPELLDELDAAYAQVRSRLEQQREKWITGKENAP